MRINKDSWLITKPIAHRGLWSDSVPENSTLAYEKASQLKIPIEIDLHLTTDGHLVSFHDDNLLRMTGLNANIYDLSLNEIKKLRLKGSEYSIPTLEEVLEIVKDKSPLLIELKNQPNKTFVEKAISRLKNYSGEFAVQSFNPFYIIKTKKLAPEIIRGILADKFCSAKGVLTRWAVRKMSFNFIAKPDFISYNHHGLPLNKNKRKNKVLLSWTITDNKTHNDISPLCDNIIYENFTPENYK